jgi:hypothetical protein
LPRKTTERDEDFLCPGLLTHALQNNPSTTRDIELYFQNLIGRATLLPHKQDTQILTLSVENKTTKLQSIFTGVSSSVISAL